MNPTHHNYFLVLINEFFLSAIVNFRFLYDAIGACKNLGVPSNCRLRMDTRRVIKKTRGATFAWNKRVLSREIKHIKEKEKDKIGEHGFEIRMIK